MTRKRSAKTAEIEDRITKAIDAIKKKEVKSAYAAEKRFGVSRSTLSRRLKGGLSVAEGRESQQLFSIAEENTLFL